MNEAIEFTQWLIPYLLLAVGLFIGSKFGITYVKEKFKFKQTEIKMKANGGLQENTPITNKIKLAMDNTDVAYEHLNKSIVQAKEMTKSTDPKIRMAGENQLKASEQEMKVLEFLMKNKTAVDMFGQPALAIIEKFEKKVTKGIKSGGFLDGLS